MNEGNAGAFSCQAVIFDMDGVLIDSMQYIEQLLRGWAADHELDPDLVVTLSHGRRDTDVVRLSAPHLDAKREAARIQDREVREAAQTKPFSGALDLLVSLPPERWAIVTSGSRRVAGARLKAGGLPLPATLITAEDVANGKPDPEGYLEAARRLNASPKQCLVVEDAPSGVAAARNAGMQVIGVGRQLKEQTSIVTDAWVDAVNRLRAVVGRTMISVWIHNDGRETR